METSFAIHKITLIGSGNVGTQLGMALYKSGHSISQVYSRTKKSADTLAKKLESKSITDLKLLDLNSDIYIIAIKDDVIADVVKQLRLKDKIVVHTSGSIPLQALSTASKNHGVFYPLQTISKSKVVDFRTIPICLEANTKKTFKLLQNLAKTISENVQEITSEQRQIIHLSAVFACNFSNHMYAIAASLLKKNHVPFAILKPLIAETASKIQFNDPQKMQTGPAVRGDYKTLKSQLKLLDGDKKLKLIYKLLSDDIIQYHQDS